MRWKPSGSHRITTVGGQYVATIDNRAHLPAETVRDYQRLIARAPELRDVLRRTRSDLVQASLIVTGTVLTGIVARIADIDAVLEDLC